MNVSCWGTQLNKDTCMHTYRRFDTQQSNLDWCWSLKPCFPVFVCSLLYSVPLRRELCPGSVPGNYPGLFAEWWSFCFPSQLVCRVCRQPYACLVLHVSFFFISAFFTPPQTLVSIFLTACPGFPSQLPSVRSLPSSRVHPGAENNRSWPRDTPN